MPKVTPPAFPSHPYVPVVAGLVSALADPHGDLQGAQMSSDPG